MEQKKKLSGWMIALLILFWPAGIAYLVIKELNKDKNDYIKTANAMLAIGAFLVFCGIYYLFAGATGNVESEDPGEILYGVITMLIFCCGGGGALLYHGSKKRKLGLLTQKYMPAIVDGGLEDMATIAKMAAVSYEQADADLRLLIGNGILKDCYIDTPKGMLVWTSQPREEDLPREKIVCPHCGGTNLVICGKAAVCEYCDSKLS